MFLHVSKCQHNNESRTSEILFSFYICGMKGRLGMGTSVCFPLESQTIGSSVTDESSFIHECFPAHLSWFYVTWKISIQYSVNYAPNGVSQRISLIKHYFFLKKNPKSTRNKPKKSYDTYYRRAWLSWDICSFPGIVYLWCWF